MHKLFYSTSDKRVIMNGWLFVGGDSKNMEGMVLILWYIKDGKHGIKMHYSTILFVINKICWRKLHLEMMHIMMNVLCISKWKYNIVFFVLQYEREDIWQGFCCKKIIITWLYKIKVVHRSSWRIFFFVVSSTFIKIMNLILNFESSRVVLMVEFE